VGGVMNLGTKFSAMKPKLLLGLALVLSGIINCRAAADTSAAATNILDNLFATKTLVLASRPKFIIETAQRQSSADSPTFNYISIITPKMIDRFSFKAQLSRPGHPPVVMQVAANPDHATVVIQTPAGQPYFLMADHLCAICGQDNPGQLDFYDAGTVRWGLFQSLDRTNADFQMSFIATNVPPAIVFDLRFIIQSSIAKMTSLAYSTNDNKIKITTSRGSLELQLAKADANDSFGVVEVKIQTGDVAFEFMDFKVGSEPPSGLFQFTKTDLEKLGVPLHALAEADLNHLNPYTPQGFPATAAERAVTDKLQELIKSRQ